MEELKRALSFSRWKIGYRWDRAEIDKTGLRVVSEGGRKAFRVMPESVTIVWVQEETAQNKYRITPLGREPSILFLTFVHGGETYAMHLTGDAVVRRDWGVDLGFEVSQVYEKFSI